MFVYCLFMLFSVFYVGVLFFMCVLLCSGCVIVFLCVLGVALGLRLCVVVFCWVSSMSCVVLRDCIVLCCVVLCCVLLRVDVFAVCECVLCCILFRYVFIVCVVMCCCVWLRLLLCRIALCAFRVVFDVDVC